MNQKTKNPNVMGRKLIQNLINKAREGWPPDTTWGIYQPYRPKEIVPKADSISRK